MRTLHLDYEDDRWISQLEQIKLQPISWLRKHYQRYFPLDKNFIQYDAPFLARKIGYKFQWLAMIFHKKPISNKLKDRTQAVFNEQFKLQERVKEMAPKKKKTSIASIVYSMLDENKTDKQIIKSVKEKFPESKINEQHMNWYRNQYKKLFEEAGNEIPKPKKKIDPVIDDDDEEDEDDELEDEDEDEDEDEFEDEEDDDDDEDEDEEKE